MSEPASADQVTTQPQRAALERLDLQSDEELARHAQKGSHVCFEELVRRYQVPLMRFVERKVGQRRDAEDIVQDAFLRAFRKLDRYRDSWLFRTWLFTITYRIALNHVRQQRPRDADRALDESISGPPAGNGLQDGEERSALWATVRRVLSEEQFSTIWLYYVEELSGTDIARVLGRSGVAVRAILFRARRKLMAHLQPDQMLAVNAAHATPRGEKR